MQNKSLLIHNLYQEKFRKIFDIPLGKFMDPITGFDIIKFDEKFLKTPDGINTREFVTKKYGKESADLLLALIQQ